MIGFFDSGLGGITVVRRVRELLPMHDLLFFADQAHVPYGERQVPDLLEIVEQNVRMLDDAGAELIVAACNTSCALGAQFGWPRTHAPVLDLIESAAIAVERSGCKRIAVFATTATARTGAYAKHIVARVPDAAVVEVAAPALVPLVEAGKMDEPETRQAVRDACRQVGTPVDAAVLGCTHYPLLMPLFRQNLGDRVLIIDPALVQAERTVEKAGELSIRPGSGILRCLTNGDPENFKARVAALLAGIPHTADSIAACSGQNSTLSR